jgi:hypothetical protein
MLAAFVVFTAHGLMDCLELGPDLAAWVAYLLWIALLYVGLVVVPSVAVPLCLVGSAHHLDFGTMHASMALTVSSFCNVRVWQWFLVQAGARAEGIYAIWVMLLTATADNEITEASLLMAAIAFADTRLFLACLLGCHFVVQTLHSVDTRGALPVASLVVGSSTIATAAIYMFPNLLQQMNIHHIISLYAAHVVFHFFNSS